HLLADDVLEGGEVRLEEVAPRGHGAYRFHSEDAAEGIRVDSTPCPLLLARHGNLLTLSPVGLAPCLRAVQDCRQGDEARASEVFPRRRRQDGARDHRTWDGSVGPIHHAWDPWPQAPAPQGRHSGDQESLP